MVKGLDVFKKHFSEHTDSYIFIGGSACYLAMSEAGLAFRATKDLDIVLCVELLDKAFVNAFWAFVREGKYKLQEKAMGKRQYYRFQKPGTEGFPFMLELFSWKPDALSLPEDSHLTPLPMDEEVSSLSAILLSDTYYHFLLSGKKILDGLTFAGPEILIPLKARAWLDLTRRKDMGETIDSKSLKKHKNDVFRMYQILTPDLDLKIPGEIKADLKQFVHRMENEDINLKVLGLGTTDIKSVIADIRKIYALD